MTGFLSITDFLLLVSKDVGAGTRGKNNSSLLIHHFTM